MTYFRFEKWQDRDGDEKLREAWIASNESAQRVDGYQVDGTCGLCGKSTRFSFPDGAQHNHPDPREDLICTECMQCSRIRAGIELLRGAVDTDNPKTQVYITEQVTPTYVWLQTNLAATVEGSEFEPSWLRRRKLTLQLRNMGGRGSVQYQDVTNLNLKNSSLDAIVTFDVLEHVPDYSAAIREFARVLKPGAICVATFPFTDGPNTIIRAKLDVAGQIEHLREPEYHGDPISGGVLCYYHFGWDILDSFRQAGFRHVEMVMPWGHERGYFYGLWTLIGTR